jgi:trimethylamine monooxygenase
MVTYNDETGLFSVTAHDLQNDHVYTQTFDFVICASGHFSVPNMPSFSLDSFPGRILHSHDFRNARHFAGMDLLVVGRSYSAEDIASQCWKYGAKSVTISWRSAPIGWDWPEEIEERPLLERCEGKRIFFKDGSSKEFDAIIYCTGYQHHFPFFPDDLRLKTENRLWPLNLYKGVVWENNPKLFYLGMQDQFYTFNMFDAQAWYVRDVILDRIPLPDKETMKKDSQAWYDREETLETDHDKIWFQGDYVKELIQATDYPAFDVDEVNRTFLLWEHHKAENIMGFRDRAYKSIMTGTMAPTHHTPWVKAMDDSMKTYLQNEAE